MQERYQIWAYGVQMMIRIAFVVFGIPLGIIATGSMFYGLTMVIFGIETLPFEGHEYDLFCFLILIFSPYFLGKHWDLINDNDKHVKINSDKDG